MKILIATMVAALAMSGCTRADRELASVVAIEALRSINEAGYEFVALPLEQQKLIIALCTAAETGITGFDTTLTPADITDLCAFVQLVVEDSQDEVTQ